MIGLNDVGQGMAKAAAGQKPKCWGVRIHDLEGKWTESHQASCTACNGAVAGVAADGRQIVSLRLWKRDGARMFRP